MAKVVVQNINLESLLALGLESDPEWIDNSDPKFGTNYSGLTTLDKSCTVNYGTGYLPVAHYFIRDVTSTGTGTSY